MYEKGIAIVGGGHGGSQVAASLRSEGYDGPICLITDESEVPYQRPPLSKAFLKDDDHALLPLRPASFYDKNAIDLRLGATVAAIDVNGGGLTLADGATIAADRIVLATGSRPRIPRAEGVDLDGVLALRNADDARVIRERFHAAESVVVVGGGFIGLEIAGTARQLGKRVTVLEAADRLMGRAVAPEISEHFLSLHRGWGADVRLNVAAGGFVGTSGRLTGVVTADGATVEADLAVIGIGVVANAELAEAAGIACEGGVLVNDFVETSVPEVLAIGDAVSFVHWQHGLQTRLESVQNAVDQGKVAARTLLGSRAPYRDVPWFWSDQGDAKLQMAGLPFGASRSVTRGDAADGSFSVFHYDGERLLAVDSVNRAGDHMVGRRLIGAGLSPSPDVVADEASDLKQLLKEMASA